MFQVLLFQMFVRIQYNYTYQNKCITFPYKYFTVGMYKHVAIDTKREIPKVPDKILKQGRRKQSTKVIYISSWSYYNKSIQEIDHIFLT